MIETLKRHFRAQMDGSDNNCHNFEFTAPTHLHPATGEAYSWNAQKIIPYHDITESPGGDAWNCPSCQKTFEVYIPLNSDMEE